MAGLTRARCAARLEQGHRAFGACHPPARRPRETFAKGNYIVDFTVIRLKAPASRPC